MKNNKSLSLPNLKKIVKKEAFNIREAIEVRITTSPSPQP